MKFMLPLLTVLTLLMPNIASAQSCRELRLACEMKDQLGERGQGNCRRYREACQQGPSCAELRMACLRKDELGERGQGNCRTYRETCRR